MPPVQWSTAATQEVPSGESCWPVPQTGTHRNGEPPAARVPAGQVQVLPTSVEPPPHVTPFTVPAAGPGPLPFGVVPVPVLPELAAAAVSVLPAAVADRTRRAGCLLAGTCRRRRRHLAVNRAGVRSV
jgi:hypothetical protein